MHADPQDREAVQVLPQPGLGLGSVEENVIEDDKRAARHCREAAHPTGLNGTEFLADAHLAVCPERPHRRLNP